MASFMWPPTMLARRLLQALTSDSIQMFACPWLGIWRVPQRNCSFFGGWRMSNEFQGAQAIAGRVSIGSAPETAASLNSSTMTKPSRRPKPSVAARWQFSLSLSAPTLVADEVRRAATLPAPCPSKKDNYFNSLIRSSVS